jgi:hypothetical protein
MHRERVKNLREQSMLMMHVRGGHVLVPSRPAHTTKNVAIEAKSTT